MFECLYENNPRNGVTSIVAVTVYKNLIQSLKIHRDKSNGMDEIQGYMLKEGHICIR